MQFKPLTFDDRLSAIGGSALVACLVLIVGFAIHRAISRNSDSKRIQGRPIMGWMSTLYFLGACFGAWIADNRRYYLDEVVGGAGGFGLLIGLVIGNIHGFLNLQRARRVAKEVSAGTDAPKDRIALEENPSSDNPYAPPRRRM